MIYKYQMVNYVKDEIVRRDFTIEAKDYKAAKRKLRKELLLVQEEWGNWKDMGSIYRLDSKFSHEAIFLFKREEDVTSMYNDRRRVFRPFTKSIHEVRPPDFKDRRLK